ncbi:MAG TPA: fumarylacetoacetate hydrolase family protein [Candidatus Eisenbacteria bacterium]|nr:fumarylacetoacetate hydrolase family protein [Candidatus Eisenbacteria bacterium]
MSTPRAPAPVRIARYLYAGTIRHGRPDGDAFVRWSAPPWEGGRETGERDPLEASRLLVPVQPSKIVCVGLNYRAHIAESATVLPDRQEQPSEPLLFLKPPSALVASGEAIRYPAGVERLDPEAELAVVIGRRARHVAEERALEHVAGYTAFDDVSARNYQRRDGQWTRAKGFDTFAPLGPWLAVGLEAGDLAVQCRVNGAVRQSARTSDLLFPVPVLVSFISRIMTLEPGDVIATGTPAGVAPIEPGDVVEVEVEGVGVLVNRVEDARGPARPAPRTVARTADIG